MTNSPAISVIMPMYNVEKYIAECLESLLAQTLQDFEVIVVNDCSLDSSRAIAESYIPKFGGRLKIFDNEKNSGPGASRNRGLRHATGEYIFFMDSDDLLLLNGLERMYTTAKQFDVDVVNSSKNYELSTDAQSMIPVNLTKTTPKNIPILEHNLEWRVQGLLADKFYWAPWRRLLRREFLIENDIFFPEEFKRCEDEIWTHGLLFCAKEIIHIPLGVYVYRMSDSSITRSRQTNLQNINIRINNIINGLQWIAHITEKVPFFKDNPQYHYAILEHSTQRFLNRLFKSSLKVSSSDMFMSIKREFGKDFGKYDVAVPVLCTMLSTCQKTIDRNKTRIAELEEQLKAK